MGFWGFFKGFEWFLRLFKGFKWILGFFKGVLGNLGIFKGFTWFRGHLGSIWDQI
jgi:hypothetical protein